MSMLRDRVKALLANNSKMCLYSAILTFLYFGIDYSVEYSTDAYATYLEKGSWTYSFYDNARPVKALIFYIIETMNLSPGICYHLSWCFAMIFLILSVFLLANMFKRFISSDKISVLLAFITLANPLIIEYFLFEEKGLFMLVILLNVIAARVTEKMWREESAGATKLWRTIIILLCLLTAVFIYQTSVQVYVILCLPLIVIYRKKFIRNNIYVGIMYIIPMAAAFFTAKGLNSERAGGSWDITLGFSMGMEIIRRLFFERFFHIQKGLFAAWMVCIICVAVISSLIMAKNRLIIFLSYLYIAIGSIAVSVIIFVLNSSALPSPRTLHSFGMLFGILLFYFFYVMSVGTAEIKTSLGKIAKALAIIIAVSIFCADYISFGKVFIDRYQCNEADRYYAQIIREKIRAYEDETGNTVDTICFYKDESVTWWDSGYGDSEMMARAQSCGWSRLNAINLYLSRNYVEGEPDEELTEYFAGKNWGMYSEEQVIFRENELHLCIY